LSTPWETTTNIPVNGSPAHTDRAMKASSMAKQAPHTRKRHSPTTATVRSRMRAIRLLSLDVDGVLTDGGLYYADNGAVSRKFDVRDGVGIKRVLALGVAVALVSAGTTRSIHQRARTLGIRHVIAGADDKLAAVRRLCRQLGYSLDHAAHVGDDLNDIPLMEAVGLPMSVAGAAPEALAAARYVARKQGGEGAVREICDLIVAAHGGGRVSLGRLGRNRGLDG